MSVLTQAAKDPSILLSWAKILQALKDGKTNNADIGSTVVVQPNLDITGTIGEADNTAAE